MNPINYANGLVTELDYAVRTGDKQRESTVREQLTWAASQLDAIDPEPLSPTTRALFDDAKLAAADALATKAKRASAKSE